MGKSVLIIGAGISGLAVGCYAQMKGYDSMIFEMHDKPGGLCTSWKRICKADNKAFSTSIG